ncbi:hypothetical protein HS088_TW01G00376 [Tripterygium wilfordii]|uniref:Uncharacterized protein n=1 Tax=Tripterygium wilfordii TaxID=458696 RepID=A0A7J7E2D3_TRIWF|nr:hypothetical protein HS088_TW01G00376 [Tripterygium wilfordii]
MATRVIQLESFDAMSFLALLTSRTLFFWMFEMEPELAVMLTQHGYYSIRLHFIQHLFYRFMVSFPGQLIEFIKVMLNDQRSLCYGCTDIHFFNVHFWQANV